MSAPTPAGHQALTLDQRRDGWWGARCTCGQHLGARHSLYLAIELYLTHTTHTAAQPQGTP